MKRDPFINSMRHMHSTAIRWSRQTIFDDERARQRGVALGIRSATRIYIEHLRAGKRGEYRFLNVSREAQ
jgi:hypothetical protein